MHAYNSPIPSFGCPWGFNLGHDIDGLNLSSWTAEKVDQEIAAKIADLDTKPLHFLDGVRSVECASRMLTVCVAGGVCSDCPSRFDWGLPRRTE